MEIQLRQRRHKVYRLHDNLLRNAGCRQKNGNAPAFGTAVAHPPAGNHILSVQALQHGNDEEALLQQIHGRSNQICGRPVPGSLSGAKHTLHQQDEPPLPSQPVHHAAHHHRCCLRTALSGKNLRPDFQGGGLRLASGVQALLTIISVDMFINADINDINEPAINNKTD